MGKAEEQALRREEVRGVRKNPIASLWADVMHTLEYPSTEGEDEYDSDERRDAPSPR